jgi:hypothetical protein
MIHKAFRKLIISTFPILANPEQVSKKIMVDPNRNKARLKLYFLEANGSPYFFFRTQVGSALFKVECRITWTMSMRFSSIFCMHQIFEEGKVR